MRALRNKGYSQPLKDYIASGKPFMGICVGMQSLFEGSDESDEPGLGIIPGKVSKFDATSKAVPHMGWSNVQVIKEQTKDEGQEVNYSMNDDKAYYFVHSYAARYTEKNKEWTLTTSQYGDELFISSVQKDNVFATQYHPEKSGYAGLNVLKSFLTGTGIVDNKLIVTKEPVLYEKHRLTKRIIACLDVRANDQGDLVVTKGDQYDTVDDWKKVIWTDESSFEIGKLSSQPRVWRNASEKFKKECLAPTFKSGRTSIMVWGAIAGGKKSKLVFMKKGMRASADFINQVYEPVLLDFYKSLDSPVLMRDGTPIYRAKIAAEWRKAKGTNKMSWPAQSSD
ncbi:Putative Glutamine amidotransferase [Rhizopus microsporus]|nr:Putative Glutamine amidotransferase [Rhizopus microsporus]